eukprot:TRINITY_DN80686_c0_g1_i1.p1 TRINITY_DN80686_c0_g1~~TRINITY_DN80686_c0_g1_i1.p1  ORF type:complete len:177 (+),score=22.57 TRINITY_DN80686_c0_g1_i1:25-531(+)
MTSSSRLTAAALLTAVVARAASGEKLVWQDCGLLADSRSIQLLEYRHEPDPIVIGQPYKITRRFRSLLNFSIGNLTEKFWTTERNASGSWKPAFQQPPLSRCGAEQYQTTCPLSAHAEFGFAEGHPSTHVKQPGEHRSIEHYYADGVFAGCAVVVYSYEMAAQKLIAV